jgi:hypothetical protein
MTPPPRVLRAVPLGATSEGELTPQQPLRSTRTLCWSYYAALTSRPRSRHARIAPASRVVPPTL